LQLVMDIGCITTTTTATTATTTAASITPPSTPTPSFDEVGRAVGVLPRDHQRRLVVLGVYVCVCKREREWVCECV
jgi:hypothetical protein